MMGQEREGRNGEESEKRNSGRRAILCLPVTFAGVAEHPHTVAEPGEKSRKIQRQKVGRGRRGEVFNQEGGRAGEERLFRVS